MSLSAASQSVPLTNALPVRKNSLIQMRKEKVVARTLLTSKKPKESKQRMRKRKILKRKKKSQKRRKPRRRSQKPKGEEGTIFVALEHHPLCPTTVRRESQDSWSGLQRPL